MPNFVRGFCSWQFDEEPTPFDTLVDSFLRYWTCRALFFMVQRERTEIPF